MEKLNKYLQEITEDYQAQENYKNVKSNIQKELDETNSINQRISGMREDPFKYINPNNISYQRQFQNTSSNNNSSDNTNKTNNTNKYQQRNNPNVEYNQVSDIYKKDDINGRLDSFQFYNPSNLVGNDNNPLFIKKPENTLQMPNSYHTKSRKEDNYNLTNSRMGSYTPMGKAIPIVNTEIHSNISSNFKNRQNYKEINSDRMSNYTPLSSARPLASNVKNVNLIQNPESSRLEE